MQPIIVWGHWGVPFRKVCIILKRLQIPYHYNIVEFQDTKKEPYISINPNGRLPAIEDPNTGMKLWETGAIILYLVEQYDTEGRISYKDQINKFQCVKWLMFQVSGQGPYFGQLAWFARFHQPKVESAIERYANEMERIFGVLDSSLEHSDWLVGDKCTFADLSFATWSHISKGLMQELGRSASMEKFPRYNRWLKTIEEMEPVKECLEEIATERAAHGLPP
ncbi:MAG: hypothetical protein Q9227_007275 [Pyrenula ochraceoflavens]